MLELYDLKKLEKKLETFKIEGEKEMYIFRGNRKYIISSSLFFITILLIASYSFYKISMGIEKATILKIILIPVLFSYVLVSFISMIKIRLNISDELLFLKIIQNNIKKKFIIKKY